MLFFFALLTYSICLACAWHLSALLLATDLARAEKLAMLALPSPPIAEASATLILPSPSIPEASKPAASGLGALGKTFQANLLCLSLGISPTGASASPHVSQTLAQFIAMDRGWNEPLYQYQYQFQANTPPRLIRHLGGELLVPLRNAPSPMLNAFLEEPPLHSNYWGQMKILSDQVPFSKVPKTSAAPGNLTREAWKAAAIHLREAIDEWELHRVDQLNLPSWDYLDHRAQ